MKEGGTLSVIGSYDTESPGLIDSAEYFTGAKEVYVIDLKSKEIVKTELHQLGGASGTEKGAILELDVETILTVDTIVHELIHLKLPEGVPQQERLVDEITGKVTEQLERQGCGEILNDPKIQQERDEAIEAFRLLDGDLSQFLVPTT